MVKGTLPILLQLWQEHLNPIVLGHRQILVLLKLNSGMEDILEEHKSEDALPAAATSEFYRACQQMRHSQGLLYREENLRAVPSFAPVSFTVCCA